MENDGRHRARTCSVALAAMLSAVVFGSTASAAQTGKILARVNGKPISAATLNEKIEELYPRVSVHGNPGGSSELRQRAMDEVILDELIWQQALPAGKVVPLADAERAVLGFRRRYGPPAFDADLRRRGLSRAQYIRKVQRALTIQSARQEHVEAPAQVTTDAVRAYYEANRQRFRRPESAHIRLILVAVEPNSSPEVERAAKEKAGDLYAQLQAGRDFAKLAEDFSEDIYRGRGGDVGWMHKGSMDPEFEPIAFSLPVGQFTAPFRTPLGYSILKVEERAPARDMSFAEIQDKLKLQLTRQRSRQLQQAWEADLKRNARIEMVDKNAGLPAVGGARSNAIMPQRSH